MPSLKLDDVQLSYVQYGDGSDIVWIPGGDQRGVHFAEQYEAFPDYRNTAYDPRGVGETVSHAPPPWTTADFARDCAALIREVCSPPVVLVGLSLGSLIVQQVVLDYPELIRVAIPMGTGGGGRNKAPGDWMRAEIAFRRAGGTLSGSMAVHHYAAFMYPSEVLGDDKLWEKCRPVVASAYEHRDSDMLIAQWEACFTFDGFEQLRDCKIPIHVIAFSQDMQTPPPSGRAVAEAAGDGHFHLLDGLGHVSLLGHRAAQVSAKIREIIEQDMNAGREHLFRRFDELGIEAPTVAYPSHRTVEEGKALRGDMHGTFTKNLLLKDKKGRLFMLVAHEDQAVDLKTLHTRIGASRSLRFASGDQMRDVLRIAPGALTPFALLNDEDALVTVVVDANLMDAEQLNFHPLANTESTGIGPGDLLRFIVSCGREALITDLGQPT